MNKFENSDLNPTMAASRTFDSILQQVQSSNLNFQLQISPFAANISLKRSPIRDRNGAPFPLPVPVPTFSHPEKYYQEPAATHLPEHAHGHVTKQVPSPDPQVVDLLAQLAAVKQTYSDVLQEKEILEKDYFSIDKSYKKLSTDNKNLQVKHEKVCAEVKALKVEKEVLAKEFNATAVALAASKKDFSENHKMFYKKINKLELELVQFREFKEEKTAENKRRKKIEKKAKQKKKKEQLARDTSALRDTGVEYKNSDEEKSTETNTDSKDLNSNDTLDNYTAAKVIEDTAEEDVPIKDDQIEPTRTVLKARTKARALKVCDSSVSTLHTDDAVEKLEDEASNDVEVKAIETDMSNSFVSSASPPATKSDLEEVWKFFEDRWNISRVST